MILTIRHDVPFLRVDLARELVFCELILPGREAGSTRSESIDPLPSLLRPCFRMSPESLVILIGGFSNQLPDHLFLPKTPENR